jgi:L-malate glycosyltransferase
MTKYILKNTTIVASDSVHLASETKKLLGNRNIPIEICQFGIKTFDVDLTKEKVFYSNRGHHDIYRIPEIIESFAKFDEHNPESDWILVIAGESVHTPKLKDLVSTVKLDNKVKFVGFLSPEENAKWYGRASYFISIPKSDGTAVSLLEAMYYECIPIVSDLPANREWIKHLENGYIATDLDHDFLSEVFNFEFKEARQNNRKRIESDGTAQASCTQIQSILNSITCN